MDTIFPCQCGSENLIKWLENPHSRGFDSLLDLEKIECLDCGNVVYGGDEESIDAWNSGEYD